MTAISPDSVISISEFRSNLASVLKLLQSDESGIRILGSHRKPQAVLMTVESFNRADSAKIVDLPTVVKKRSTLLRLANSYGIERVGVFGSVARGDQSRGSDLDLAIETKTPLSTLDMTAFALDAENVFDCKVDVVSLRGLRTDRHNEILKDLVYL